MCEVQSQIVFDMAKALVDISNKIDRAWTKVYYRFYLDETESGANASLATSSSVALIGALDHPNLYSEENGLSKKLFAALNKKRGLLLLVVNSQLDYEIQFEFENLDRWGISKMDGATGIPEGLAE